MISFLPDFGLLPRSKTVFKMVKTVAADSSRKEDKRTGRAIAQLKVTMQHLETFGYKKSMKDFFKSVVKGYPKELVFYHELGNYRDHLHIVSLLR